MALCETIVTDYTLEENDKYILWNNQQMQLYAVNFIPLLVSLYMFRVCKTPETCRVDLAV